MSHARLSLVSWSLALVGLVVTGPALAADDASSRAPVKDQPATVAPSHAALATDERTARSAHAPRRAAHRHAGLQAAKAGTGASAVAAEKSEHMPVPKTGM